MPRSSLQELCISSTRARDLIAECLPELPEAVVSQIVRRLIAAMPNDPPRDLLRDYLPPSSVPELELRIDPTRAEHLITGCLRDRMAPEQAIRLAAQMLRRLTEG